MLQKFLSWIHKDSDELRLLKISVDYPELKIGIFSYSNYFTGIHDTSAATNIYQGLPSSSEPFDASVVVPTSSDDQMTPLQQVMAMQSYGAPPPFQYNMAHPFSTSSISNSNNITRYPIAPPTSELETDPRQLEVFAEHFKQRRIKLGVTQVC